MRRQQSNAIALTLVYCRAFEKEALEDDLHNSLRSVIARSRAVHCVAFLANSAAIGCKKTPCASSPSALHRLARVMQVILNSTTSEYRAGWAQAITVHYASCKSTRASATIWTAASCDAVHTHTGAMACEPLFAQWVHMALAEGHRIKEARSADTAATVSAFSLKSEVGRVVTQPQVDMP